MADRKRVVFEVTVEFSADTYKEFPDAEEAEDMTNVVLDGLGFPNGVTVTTKLLRREP